VSDTATVWPRRRRSAVDDAMLTVAGCSSYLQRQRGRENGFYDPAEPIARAAADESPSQLRDREAARAMRLNLGPGAFQILVTAYAEEHLKELEAEDKKMTKGSTTDAEA